jgi:hypothetical protein
MQSSHPWICDSRARNIWDTQVSQSENHSQTPVRAPDQCDLSCFYL